MQIYKKRWKLFAWWLGFFLCTRRLNVGLYIWDGWNFSEWELSVCNLPPAGACLGGTWNLAVGPIRIAYVRNKRKVETVCLLIS